MGTESDIAVSFYFIIIFHPSCNTYIFPLQIEQEFNLMYPSAPRRFLGTFELEIVPKLLKIASNETTKRYSDCNHYGENGE